MRYEEKIKICKSCESFDKEKFKCKECGCFLGIKARVPFAKCPLKKWQNCIK